MLEYSLERPFRKLRKYPVQPNLNVEQHTTMRTIPTTARSIQRTKRNTWRNSLMSLRKRECSASEASVRLILALFLIYSHLALFCFGAWIAHFIHCEGSHRQRHNPAVKKDYKPRRLSYHGVGEGTFLWLDEYFLRAGSNKWEQKVLLRIESRWFHCQKLLNLCLLWRVSRQKCSCGLLEI